MVLPVITIFFLISDWLGYFYLDRLYALAYLFIYTLPVAGLFHLH